MVLALVSSGMACRGTASLLLPRANCNVGSSGLRQGNTVWLGWEGVRPKRGCQGCGIAVLGKARSAPGPEQAGLAGPGLR